MIILGIETSCDETAAAVVENGTKILSNVVASSVDMHTKTGGIIPEQAARQQVRSILPVISEALAEAARISNGSAGSPSRAKSRDFQFPISNELLNDKIQNWIKENVDAIAVTVGPGLIGSLLVGVEAAKTLAYLTKKPIIPVNHLAAHIYANWIETSNELPKFPALALVVSGGHTDLVLMRGHGDLEWIGGTKDDAAGEAFDKTARLLGLGYPGGPAISAAAEKCQILSAKRAEHDKLRMFPRPMIEEDNFDFSFSGLKTAVLRETQKLGSNLQPLIPKLAVEVQEAIVDVLVEKTLRAVKKFKPKSLLLAGGVAANSRLREKFQERFAQLTFSLNHSINFLCPPPSLCTDNATCVASCAYFNFSPYPWEKLTVNPELTIVGEI